MPTDNVKYRTSRCQAGNLACKVAPLGRCKSSGNPCVGGASIPGISADYPQPGILEKSSEGKTFVFTRLCVENM